MSLWEEVRTSFILQFDITHGNSHTGHFPGNIYRSARRKHINPAACRLSFNTEFNQRTLKNSMGKWYCFMLQRIPSITMRTLFWSILHKPVIMTTLPRSKLTASRRLYFTDIMPLIFLNSGPAGSGQGFRLLHYEQNKTNFRL
jgi:hypothetical protein